MPSGKTSGKVAGALLLVTMIAYEICGYPAPVYFEDYEPGLRAIIEELERQGLAGPVVTRAVGGNRNEVIRKSVSPSDFRLRFGKRSVSVVPAEAYLDKTQQNHHQNDQPKKWYQQLMQQTSSSSSSNHFVGTECSCYIKQKEARKNRRMNEYEEARQATGKNTKQKETEVEISPWIRFLGLPTKMGKWVLGKKRNDESTGNTGNRPLPLRHSPTRLLRPPSSIAVAASPSSDEISEDEDYEPREIQFMNINYVGGLAEELGLVYDVNERQQDVEVGGESVNEGNEDDEEKQKHDCQDDSEDDDKSVDEEKEDDDKSVDEEKEDDEGKQKNQTADQSDSVSTDSFASAPSPLENCNRDFTLVKIKQEPPDEEEIQEVDEHGDKVKVVKFPVKELADLFRCRKELEAFKKLKMRDMEKSGTLQQGSHDAPIDLEAVSEATGRRNPGRSAKKSNKKSVKSKKSVKKEKNKKKSAIKETKEKRSKKKRTSSAAAKEKKRNTNGLSCLECSKTFTTKSGLRNHELSHKRSNGQFKCKVCGRDQFKTAHHLRQHEACHFPSEKCNYCEKLFGTRSNLKNHQKTNKLCKANRQNGAGQ